MRLYISEISEEKLSWYILLDRYENNTNELVYELKDECSKEFARTMGKYYSIDADIKNAIVLETMYKELLNGFTYSTKRHYLNSVKQIIENKYKDIIKHQQTNKQKIHYIKDNEGLPILIHFDSMENYDNILIDDTNSIRDIDTRIAIEQDNRLTEKEKILLKLYLNDYDISDLKSSKILGVSPYKVKSMKNNIFAKLKKLNIL